MLHVLGFSTLDKTWLLLLYKFELFTLFHSSKSPKVYEYSNVRVQSSGSGTPPRRRSFIPNCTPPRRRYLYQIMGSAANLPLPDDCTLTLGLSDDIFNALLTWINRQDYNAWCESPQSILFTNGDFNGDGINDLLCKINDYVAIGLINANSAFAGAHWQVAL